MTSRRLCSGGRRKTDDGTVWLESAWCGVVGGGQQKKNGEQEQMIGLSSPSRIAITKVSDFLKRDGNDNEPRLREGRKVHRPRYVCHYFFSANSAVASGTAPDDLHYLSRYPRIGAIAITDKHCAWQPTALPRSATSWSGRTLEPLGELYDLPSSEEDRAVMMWPPYDCPKHAGWSPLADWVWNCTEIQAV